MPPCLSQRANFTGIHAPVRIHRSSRTLRRPLECAMAKSMAVSRPSIPDVTLESLTDLLGDKRPAYLRGLMTAIVTGPARLPDRDALDDVLAAFPDQNPAAANDARTPLQTLFEQTRELQEQGDFSLGNETPFPMIVQWCQGYLDGMQQDSEWLEDKHALLFVLPITAIAQAEQEDGAPTNEKLEQCIERLPFVVPSLYRYWGDKRGPQS